MIEFSLTFACHDLMWAAPCAFEVRFGARDWVEAEAHAGTLIARHRLKDDVVCLSRVDHE